MAPETFYYFLSIFLVLIAVFHISHMIYFRARGKTFLGEVFKPGKPGYKKINKLASASGLTIAIVLALLFVANLAYDISRVAHINTSDARFLLIFAPAVTILIFCGALFTTRKYFSSK